MNETVKTLIYAGVAAVLVAAAVVVNLPPSIGKGSGGGDDEKILYPEFTDPKTAARMEIVRVDDAKGGLSRFEVHKTPDGRWVIPSHGEYPADATEQMSIAANSLINLPIIGVASEVAGDQELYGVVEPTQKRLDEGDKGFGIMVSFQDKKGEDLAQLVIGKKVANTEDHHFVRKVGQDKVYVVAINTDKLSTNFGDWIEKDLLKISPWDIDRVTIKDYRLIVKPTREGVGIETDQRLELTVGVEEGGSSWIVDKFTQFSKNKPIPSELSAEEELNKEALDTLKSAVDNLQIVDVEAKPKGLGAAVLGQEELEEEQLALAFNNPDIREKLQEVGFLPAPVGNKYSWKGANGEMTVGTKDGVEYVIRFGNSREAEKGTTKEGAVKARRYVFVTARLDQSRLKPPALEALPDSAVPTPQPKEEGDQEEAKEEKPGDGSGGADDDDMPMAGAKQDDLQEENTDENKADEEKTGEEKKPSTTDFDLKRKQIEKENQRRMDEYNDRKKKAEAKVRELNARFAPWYYVVSDDEFHKIHLTRNDVIKEKTGPGAEGFGIDAYRELEKGGVDRPLAPIAPPGGAGPGPGRGGLPPGINFGN